MPLLASATQEQVEQPPPQPPPSFRPDVQLEAPYITWASDRPGSTERLLACGPEASIMAGILGLDLPPDQQFESELAAGDGSVFVGRRRLPRELIFPVEVRAKSLTTFEQRRRSLMRDFDPKYAGTFVWQLPDGTRRSLHCRLSDMSRDDGGHRGAQLVNRGVWRVTLRAVDPYWYGEERGRSWRAPGELDFYNGGTAPPYNISQSNTLGTVTIDIDGEEDTWPEWWLRGPMTTARLAHPTRGTLDLAPQMPAERGMVVRTDPRLQGFEQVVIGDVVENPEALGGGWELTNPVLAWDRVDGQFPVFWPLESGTQTIEIFAAGTTDDSEVRLRYWTRYLTS